MSVRKATRRDPKTGRSRKFWIIDIDVKLPDGTRVRKRRVPPIQTRRGAEQFERELRAQLLRGDLDQQPVPLLKDFRQEFMDNYVRAKNRPSEVRTKECILRAHIMPAFGHMRLDEITAREIARFVATRQQRQLKAKTINNILTVLGKMLRTAQDWGYLEHVPKLGFLKTRPPEIEFLDFDEAAALQSAAEPFWYGMITVALRSGLRRGELMALRWSDVDLEAAKPVIHVRRSLTEGCFGLPKSGKPRWVPLTYEARSALEDHPRWGELIFCQRGGSPLTEDRCRRPLERAYKKANLKPLGWHALRHSYASHLVMKGTSLRAVQELLGHADLRTTMRYAHLAEHALFDAVQVLP